jgi:hypothetical protein
VGQWPAFNGISTIDCRGVLIGGRKGGFKAVELRPEASS